MGRIPCCEEDNVKRGQWTPEADNKLSSFTMLVPQKCGKSCGLRWAIYLRPDLRTVSSPMLKLTGRADYDVKNHWNTKLMKRLLGKGLDPVTHKPFSHLMVEIATTLAPPQVAHLAEATFGCFKDEMLHLLTKKRIDYQLQQSAPLNTTTTYVTTKNEEKDDTVEKITLNLSRAIQDPEVLTSTSHGTPTGVISANFPGTCSAFPAPVTGFQYRSSSFGHEGAASQWSESMRTGSTCTAGEQQGRLHEKVEVDNREEFDGGKGTRNGSPIFNADCVLWDLPADGLITPTV